MAQIGGYLTPEEHAEFKRYAAAFQLKESSLANLLLVREMRLGRLGRLKEVYLPQVPMRSRGRVTAHQPDGTTKEAFEAHARAEGLKPDQAAAVLFRAELTERWLDMAIEQH